ncbi:HpcH/HpaI aldolase/citrate lyase family protein [Sphingopyxis sp. 550A]
MVHQHEKLSLRSLLFVPADSERKLAKAIESEADVVILDLEDAVAPPAKDNARRLASDLLGSPRRKRVAVRINAADTHWHLADLAAIGRLAPDIIMLPKCGGGADIDRLCAQLSVLETAAGIALGSTRILPLVTETAAALRTMDYRDASPRLCALGFAGEDLAADLGVAARDEAGMNPLLTDARHMVAIAAAAAGVAAVDTPFPDPRDDAGLAREAAAAARTGFSGKMCIHPGQLAEVQDAFTPSDASLAWARSVVGAFAASPDEGVALLDGKMVDRAHLRLAERRLGQVPSREREIAHAD